ncbi:putative metal-binding protein [Clostridium fallax]|uniref:Metal-binding protein n=2 Tax=Clostridium fallax TaxID=1533 RepID=A0A1M4UVB2_9CLOT|nr:uncharacterized protein SAMN05443638_10623 [Clostridium fallax]SQB06859.1 putative metal-binding protein [Clostridium fallax]
MVIDFSDNYLNAKKFDYEFTMDSIKLDGEEIVPLKPIKVIGEVRVHDSIIILKAKVNTLLELTCSRCLENFSLPIDLEVEDKFTNNTSKDLGDDVALVLGDTLDITDTIVKNIISTLPIKRLCSENCKGLCQQCGTNLNKANCNCDNGDVDIRLAKLKDLFS